MRRAGWGPAGGSVGRRWLAAALLAVAAPLAGAGAVRAAVPADGAGGDAPPSAPGYALTQVEQLAEGVTREVHVRRQPAQVNHVVRVAASAPVDLQVVVSNDAVADRPGLERTTSMCARTGCIAAVNGDFTAPGTHEPLGGVVAGGELVRTPSPSHDQVTIGADRSLVATGLEWTGQLMPTDLRPLRIDGVNVARPQDGLVLYTHRYGPSTGTTADGAELVVVPVAPEPLRLGVTVQVELRELRRGGSTPIPAGGAVLSGHGRSAALLVDLWGRVEQGAAARDALVRVESPVPVADSVGGTPVLLRRGEKAVGAGGPPFVTSPHPRTAVGWTADGDVLLLVADGRQSGYSLGLSLPETADFLAGLGAVDAVNLDGGGSSTLVAGGAVANRPSDRLVRRHGAERVVPVPARGDQVLGTVERPVTAAVVVVPRRRADGSPPAAALRRPLAVRTVPVGAGVESDARTDPASDPLGHLPALVAAPERLPAAPPALPALAALAALAAVTSHVPSAVRSWRRPRRPDEHRPGAAGFSGA